MASPVESFQTTLWNFVASNATTPNSDAAFSGGISLEPVSDNVGSNQIIAPTQSIMGSRFEFSSRSRITSELVSGQLVFEASPDVLDFFLPFITATASTPFILAEACLDFDFQRSEPGTTWQFRNCFVTQATLAPSGGMMRLTLDITGKLQTINATFVPKTIQVDGPSEGMTEAESAVNIASAQRYCESWQLVISNGLELFQRQSLTYNRARLGPASVTLNANVEWSATAEAALYNQGAAGLAATVVLDNGTKAYTATMPGLVIPANPLNVDGGETLWNFSGVSRRTVASANIISIAVV